MYVKSLNLKSFRNYDNVSVSFEPGINFIVGNNGTGKTNLVEAIYFLSLSRSFKKCSDEDLIKRDKTSAELTIEYFSEKDKEEHLIGATITKKGKAFYFDREKVPQLSKVLGNLSSTSYDPSSVFMFKDDPQERRRFLDETLGVLSKDYLYTLSRYKKILKERNTALSQSEYDRDVLAVLTKELIKCDFIIAKQRFGLVERLNTLVDEIFREIEQNKKLELKYVSTLPNITDSKTFMEQVEILFEKKKSEEAIKKCTLIGIHRDDLKAKIDNQDLDSYCSQGQNRLATFALKMAVAKLIEEIKGEKPIIILDDVLSDLDITRCKNILMYLEKGGQTFITVAEIGKVELTKNYKLYEIDNNEIVRRR